MQEMISTEKCTHVQKGWVRRPVCFSLTGTQNCNLSTDSIVLIQSSECTASLPRERSAVEAQAASCWMKYFPTDPCRLCRAGLALRLLLMLAVPCPHRYTCWLLAPMESVFAESKHRCLCFQVLLWCSTVRWMNGTGISTKKKKKIEWVSFSKARTIGHTSARAQGEMHFCSYYVASVLIQVLPVQL